MRFRIYQEYWFKNSSLFELGELRRIEDIDGSSSSIFHMYSPEMKEVIPVSCTDVFMNAAKALERAKFLSVYMSSMVEQLETEVEYDQLTEQRPDPQPHEDIVLERWRNGRF
jgi:hypothetical protein